MAYAEKRGKSWRVRFQLPDGKYDSESGFETKQDALDHGRAQETDVKRKVFVNPKDGRQTLGSWADEWIKVMDVAETSDRTYHSRLNAVILPKWKDTPLGDITATAYKAWRNKLADEFSKNYVDGIEGMMRMLLDDAVEERLIPFNPMPSKSAPPRPARPRRHRGHLRLAHPRQALLVAENARALRGDQWYAMILTMAYTGMRMGEIAGLRRDQLRLLGLEYGRHLRVQWQGQWLSTHAKHDVVKGETCESIAELRLADPTRAGEIAELNEIDVDARIRVKRKLLLPKGFTLVPPKYSSYRTLILPPFLADLLAEQLAKKAHDTLVFPSQRGKPLRVDDQFYGRFWHPVLNGQDAEPKRRGRPAQKALPAVKGVEDMVPHGTRHGHKVWLDGQGHPRVAVEERMGHKLKGVEGTYSHTSGEMELAIAQGLQKLWETSQGAEEKVGEDWAHRRSG